MSKKTMPAMTPTLRFQAQHVALMLLAEGQADELVQAALEYEFKLSADNAGRVIADAWRLLRDVPDPDLAQRKRELTLRIKETFRAAFEAKQFSACKGLIELEAKLHRLIGEDVPLGAPKASELGNRTDAELVYYTEHGHWPDEAPRRVKRGTADPLARLN